MAAEQLADHRLAYLDYEGPVSGDRGSVARLDSGIFLSLEESPDLWVVDLTGHVIRGRVTLRRSVANGSDWQLAFQGSTATDRQ